VTDKGHIYDFKIAALKHMIKHVKYFLMLIND
jgi:hypothetical protein